jgi:FkbM family methyltransferase
VATFIGKARRRALRDTFGRWARSRKYRRIWIDVGAHEGETTFPFASVDRTLLVYAFEPNLQAASRIMGRLRNYVVLPIAIAERDGSAELHLTAYEPSSSLLPADQVGIKSWVSEVEFKVVGSVTVPTMRLDTFMNGAGIESVDYLKIDAQGLDLEVVKSAGDRLRDVAKVQLEATTSSYRQYEGAPGKPVIVEYMAAKGFRLAGEESQSHGQEANLTFLRV